MTMSDTDETPPPSDAPLPASPPAAAVQGGTGDPTAGTLLVVDASPATGQRVADALATWGYAVRVARSALEALALLARDGDVDVVLTDLRMPKLDGLALMRRFAELGCDVPFIMLSSHADIHSVLGAVREGAFDYVLKDEELAPLRRSVERAVTQVGLMRENRALLGQLHDLNRQLERRVSERTHRLEEVNARLMAERGELEGALQRLAQAQAQLVQTEKMASIGLLTAGVAHEINNPLAFLLPNLEHLGEAFQRLRDGRLTGDAARAELEDGLRIVEDCREGLVRIRDIVRELGLFSRDSEDPVGPVDLANVVASVLTVCGSQFRNAALSVDLPPSLPPVRGNAGGLRQVLLNVLLNGAQAVAATPQGAVTVAARGEAGGVVVEVADNGVGMSEEHAQRAFDPFFTTKGVGQGTGMGLLVARQLLARMGGRIELRSALGVGTVVTLRLPFWQESVAPAT